MLRKRREARANLLNGKNKNKKSGTSKLNVSVKGNDKKEIQKRKALSTRRKEK